MVNIAEKNRALDYVVSRSWRCHMYKRNVEDIVNDSLEYFETHEGEIDKQDLTLYLEQRLVDRVKNPILIFILLNIVLPIVIKLILEWWENRNS